MPHDIYTIHIVGSGSECQNELYKKLLIAKSPTDKFTSGHEFSACYTKKYSTLPDDDITLVFRNLTNDNQIKYFSDIVIDFDPSFIERFFRFIGFEKKILVYKMAACQSSDRSNDMATTINPDKSADQIISDIIRFLGIGTYVRVK